MNTERPDDTSAVSGVKHDVAFRDTTFDVMLAAARDVGVIYAKTDAAAGCTTPSSPSLMVSRLRAYRHDTHALDALTPAQREQVYVAAYAAHREHFHVIEMGQAQAILDAAKHLDAYGVRDLLWQVQREGLPGQAAVTQEKAREDYERPFLDAKPCAGCGLALSQHDMEPPHECVDTECEGFRGLNDEAFLPMVKGRG